MSFSIPSFPVHILSAFFMLNGAIAGGYILWRFAIVEFEDYITIKSFIGVNLLISLLLITYLWFIF